MFVKLSKNTKRVTRNHRHCFSGIFKRRKDGLPDTKARVTRCAGFKMRNKYLRIAVILLGSALFLFLLWPHRASRKGFRLPAGPVAPVISLGDSYGVVVAGDGTLWTWGHEDRGWPVLGQGKNRYSAALVLIDDGSNWIAAAAGDAHALALKNDGSVWSWGGNFRHQLGDHSTVMTNRVHPTLASNDVTQVAAGFSTGFFLKKDGSLWGWGLNNFSQLGILSITDAAVPTRIGAETNWIKIRTGGVSSAGIQSDGTLWIWGGSPEFGNSKREGSIKVPTLVNDEADWTDVTVAFNLWAAVKSDGSLWVWGQNASRFNPIDTPSEIPGRIGMESDWESCIASSGGTSLLLKKKDGSFWTLQSNATGPTLTRVELPKDVVAFGAGGGAFAVATKSGEVWTWGMVLGQPTTRFRIQRTLIEWSWRLGWKKLPRGVIRPETIFRPQPWQLEVAE
ncbi:MAG TPA: hypothetical protein VK327_13720 [Candidatus Paceibacterota bacterium]|nr:hypothetical protein [Candidatus Paceibacterota bacterium]